MNFIFLKSFLIVCFSKTIICDSSVIITLGVMLVNHKIQIFLDFSKFHPKAPIQLPGQDAPRPLPSSARVLFFFLPAGSVSQSPYPARCILRIRHTSLTTVSTLAPITTTIIRITQYNKAPFFDGSPNTHNTILLITESPITSKA